jgi:hypothetical protein
LEALRQKRRRKFEKRREKTSSRRSSKGSGAVDMLPLMPSMDMQRPPQPQSVSKLDAPAPAPRAPRPPAQPKKPRGNKVGRPRKKEEPDEIREITFEEKRELSEVIPSLTAEKLNRVVQIIHESMPHLKDVCFFVISLIYYILVIRTPGRKLNWILTRWICSLLTDCGSLSRVTQRKRNQTLIPLLTLLVFPN